MPKLMYERAVHVEFGAKIHFVTKRAIGPISHIRVKQDKSSVEFDLKGEVPERDLYLL